MSQRKTALRVPPLIVAGLMAVFMWLLATYVPLVLVVFAGQWIIALIFALFGAQLAIASVRALHDNETTVNPLQPDTTSALVTSGVFRLSRNPIYLGFLSALIGFAIWLGALTSILVLPFFVWYMNRFQIRPEEAALHARFGEEFEHYTRQVRRWI